MLRNFKLVLNTVHFKYKTNILPKIVGPICVTTFHITKDPTIHNIGDIVCYSTGVINYLSFYLENYSQQLDKWRNNEAQYEEKEEPPKWSLKIENVNEYSSKHFLLGSLVLNNYFYISLSLQIIAFLLTTNKLNMLIDFLPDII